MEDIMNRSLNEDGIVIVLPNFDLLLLTVRTNNGYREWRSESKILVYWEAGYWYSVSDNLSKHDTEVDALNTLFDSLKNKGI